MNPDVLICSHPRSGGRWLRFLLGHYLTDRYRLGPSLTAERLFSVVPDHEPNPVRGYPAFAHGDRRDLPLVAVCHQSFDWQTHRAQPIVFLARNPYDVVVSAFSYQSARSELPGSMRDFIEQPRGGLSAWIEYMNGWARALLSHRDALFIAYGDLHRNPGDTLIRLLGFLDELIETPLVGSAVASAEALRSTRRIRTGQEGNFWDHLQPEEIFTIQEEVHRRLSAAARRLLERVGVEIDPFPRMSS